MKYKLEALYVAESLELKDDYHHPNPLALKAAKIIRELYEEVEVLKLEQELTAKTHLDVVNRLQKELDQVKRSRDIQARAASWAYSKIDDMENFYNCGEL